MKKTWILLVNGLIIFFSFVGILFTIYSVKNVYNEPAHEIGDSKSVNGTADEVNEDDQADQFDQSDQSNQPNQHNQPDKEPGDESVDEDTNKSDIVDNKPTTSDNAGKDVNDTVVVNKPPAAEKQDKDELSHKDDKQLPAEEVKDKENQESADSKTQGKSLDTSKLSGLSNKKYGWWVREKSEHQPPVIDPTFKKLLDKYDGIFIGNTEEKVIYLTFDEGYENGYTPQILDTLKENDVKAVFFITGSYMKKNKDLVRRMLDEGHIVGGHTINHPSLPTVSDNVLENELYGFEKEYNSIFNEKIKYIRPPNGEFSERTLAATQLMGYKSVFWSLTYRDFETDKQKGADYAYKMVMDKLHNGAVILLHAVSSDNAGALDRIIKDTKALGYEFRLLDL